MTNLFLTVLDMSLTASVVILAVLLARLLLGKQPKVLSYALWSVVLFRLLCPVSFSAPVSVVAVAQPQVAAVSETASRAYHLTAAMPASSEPVTQVPQRLDAEPESQTVQPIQEKPETSISLTTVAAWIWLAGMAVLVLSSLLSFGKLRRALVGAAPLQGNVYLADHIPTPFVLGLFRPKIYLPSGVSEQERPYILAHEAHHIRRGDPIFKLLGYVALCLHWFNPLVWLAFCLSGKDMEMSCDEAVIRKLGEHTRADYAQTLLRLTTGKSVIAGIPLAFGEGDTESRVKNLARWRKPKLWAVAIGAALCALAVFLCAGNPGGQEEKFKIATIDDFTIEIPWEYGMIMEEDATLILKGRKEAGGFRWLEVPEEVRGDAFADAFWLSSMLAREHGVDVISIRETSRGDGYLWLSSKAGDGIDRSQHHFYEHGNAVYELWFMDEVMPIRDQQEILYRLVRPDPVPVEAPTATEEVQPVTIGLNLPMDVVDLEGWGTVDRKELRFFPVAGMVVSDHLLGGLRTYETPEQAMSFADMKTWLQTLGVPEILDEEHDWMASSGSYGDLEVSFIDAAGRETMHYYYIKEQQVFELWLDPAALDAMTRAAILQSVTFGPDAKIERTLPRIAEYPFEEDVQAHEASAALERCRSALEELQGSDYHVKLYRSRYGSTSVSSVSNTETQYHYFSGENWLQVDNPRPRDAYAEVISEGTPLRALYRNGEYYSNLNSEQDVLQFVSDDKVWENQVWLHRFSWDAQEVVYRSTTPAGSGQCIELQVMAPYDENSEGGYQHYFVNFIFDEKVVLQRLEITAYYQHPTDGDYSIQETISILGRGFSEAEIEKAWRQAEKE